jgi:hypothetical protein
MPSCPQVQQAARKHAIAEATLVGVYQRQLAPRLIAIRA